MKSLLIIDDKPVRKMAFAQADKLLRKLDRLEQNFQSFYDQDQRLFLSWFELTFREERKQIADLQDEYRQLSKFHNWIIAASKMLDISIPAAIHLLVQEDERYACGSEAERARIEEARKKRDEFIREEIEREYGSSFEQEEDIFDEEDQIDDEMSARDAEEEAELRTITEMSDKKIHKVCREQANAFAILQTILGCARTAKEYALFLRVWDLVPNKHQVSFAKHFTKYTGESFKTFMEHMREMLAEASMSDDDKTEEDDSSGNHDQFHDEFIAPGNRRHREKTSPDTHEAVKILYRKLVRRLHPDLQQEGTNPSHWQKSIWDRVQTANRNLDRRQLEKLFYLVLIRSRDLNELTIGEIIDSQKWLNEEIERVNQEAQGLKNLPAWGFSRRKDFAPLQRKLAKPLLKEMQIIEEQVSDLKAQHEFLRLLAMSETPRRKARRKKSRKSSARSSRPNINQTRARKYSPSQRSFFD